MHSSTRPPVTPRLRSGQAPRPRSAQVPRSPEWPRVARAHLIAHPECAACGSLWKPTTPVQVHHVFPVHFCRALQRPELELTEANLITLCSDLPALPGQDHHLLIGHLDDFEAANPATRADAVRYRGMTAAQIRTSASWRSSVLRRLPALEQMSAAQRQAMRALMDQLMPPTRSN